MNSQKRYFAYRNKPIQHLVQSKYAQDYLATRFLETPRMLSDYTPDISQIESSNRPASERTIVSYNYAKAASLTEKVVRELNSNIEFVPIKGMQRHQVYKVLGQSLVYMDLGNHPGKDRLPREAAVAGATVVVGTRGAGANNEDVPIPAELKVPADRNLVTNAAIILENIFRDPTVYEPAMQDYRLKVKKEKKLFDDETKSIFGAVFS
ncbi:hypothetical protein [Gordonia polyisoprenivorans]|uniref:hypothetical protein n=1 Tax=Gordonia polyisoprenivorans TaxID=84595 RepID=UPI0012DC0132|nr:hypothetical protein [Gordonia polyisoprenivorans]